MSTYFADRLDAAEREDRAELVKALMALYREPPEGVDRRQVDALIRAVRAGERMPEAREFVEGA